MVPVIAGYVATFAETVCQKVINVLDGNKEGLPTTQIHVHVKLQS